MRAARRLELPVSLADEMVGALPCAVLLVDANKVVIAANPAALALFETLDPLGSTLSSVLTLAGATGKSDLFAAFAQELPGPTRLHLGGRTLEARCAPTRAGTVISLYDMGATLEAADRQTADSLTGLLNRASLCARLDVTLQSVAPETSVAVLCLNLSRFKAVNDTLGLPIGDALLVKVAERLRSASRRGEVIARMGADEFAIFLPAGDPAAAQVLAARIVDLVARTYVVGGHSISVGAHIGVALSQQGLSAPELLKRADLALHRAKSKDQDGFNFFEPEMDERMQRRRVMELDLRRALALRELSLNFQPQYELATGALSGFEALLRWTNPARGPVSPADFIPLAEEIGLMGQIGDWVLRSACEQASTWDQPLTIAVNLSATQFANPRLVESVASALTQAGLAPGRLELEITESALLDETDSVVVALRGLRALGIKISMDDFGTGYSSLSYLQKFPFSKIKIDQSFVRRIEQDDESRAIVRAVAAMAAGLGMTTTAEGVETPAQLAMVAAEGCTHVQGYFTGRPLPAIEAAALVTKNQPMKTGRR